MCGKVYQHGKTDMARYTPLLMQIQNIYSFYAIYTLYVIYTFILYHIT